MNHAATLVAALLIAGCGGLANTEPPAEPPQAVEAVAPAPEPPPDYLAQGKQQGYEAAVAAQNAEGNEWYTVSQQWTLAIKSLERVSKASPDYAAAQAKIAEYVANKDDVAESRHRAYQSQAQLRSQPPQAVQPPAASRSAFDEFEAKIASVDPSGALVSSAEKSAIDCEHCIDITVTANYLALNKAVRLELAKNLWNIWAAQVSPGAPDEARIYLVTQSGTRVGGSGMWGGSMISVDD